MLYDALTEAAGDALGYDLKARYAEFNRAYFEGRLPTIPVSFSNLKAVGGKVATKIRPGPNGPPDPRMVRFGRARRYDGYTIIPGTMRLVISSLYLRSHAAIDAILLHEMAHVWFQAVIGDLNEDHGPNFRAKIAELSQASGIKVPLVDDAVGLEVTPEKRKIPLAVMIIKHSGRTSFGIASAKNAHANLAKEEATWTRRLTKDMSVTYYIVSSEAWSTLAAGTAVSRGEVKKLYNFGPTDPVDELMTDLKAHGDVLFHIAK